MQWWVLTPTFCRSSVIENWKTGVLQTYSYKYGLWFKQNHLDMQTDLQCLGWMENESWKILKNSEIYIKLWY